MADADSFSKLLLRWHRREGRSDLPWQRDRDPYRIWISEIMLQQTQVTTVIPYYERFMTRFPHISALASAKLDAVLAEWTGLGYYARARHLHQAAGVIVARYGGVFPDQFDDVVALPGIGRSTAGAILAFSHGQRHAILDGNVKRVLSRYHAVEGWSGRAEVARRLWSLAEAHTPTRSVAAYTQAIMDLGAMVCRRRPNCVTCPLAGGCKAHNQNQVHCYPTSKPTRPRPRREVVMIMIKDSRGRVLLERRAPSGIWGGLWSFPECPIEEALEPWCRMRFGAGILFESALSVLRHSFTHFELAITPQPARAPKRLTRRMQSTGLLWYKPGESFDGGLAGPVRFLLQQMETGN